MSMSNIRVCDRCGKKVTVPYLKLTVHHHHDRNYDLCGLCYPILDRWLSIGSLPLITDEDMQPCSS